MCKTWTAKLGRHQHRDSNQKSECNSENWGLEVFFQKCLPSQSWHQEHGLCIKLSSGVPWLESHVRQDRCDSWRWSPGGRISQSCLYGNAAPRSLWFGCNFILSFCGNLFAVSCLTKICQQHCSAKWIEAATGMQSAMTMWSVLSKSTLETLSRARSPCLSSQKHGHQGFPTFQLTNIREELCQILSKFNGRS